MFDNRSDAPMPAPSPYDTIAGTPQPTRPPSPIDDALAYAMDRLDRVEHVLGDLNGAVMRLGGDLEPILTDGSYGEPGVDPGVPQATTSAEDRRSTVARRIHGLATRADQLADSAGYIRDRVAAIVDAIEV